MVGSTQSLAAPGPPRSMAWVLLLASAVAVLAIGFVATVLIVGDRLPAMAALSGRFWVGFVAAAGLTIAGVQLRALRWVFLMRRAETRVPIRDAYVGYLAGFSLLLAPLFLGEIGVRAWILRRRGGVPAAVTAALTLWERGFDVLALLILAGLWGATTGDLATAALGLGLPSAFIVFTPARRALLTALTFVVNRVVPAPDGKGVPVWPRLLRLRTALVTLATSVVAWTLPALGFWLIAGDASSALTAVDAVHAYAASTLAAGLSLVPAGVVVTGGQLLDRLAAAGVTGDAATVVVLASRLATVGVATAFGLVFVGVHLRSPQALGGDHFDAIADAYDVQIPEARRVALLTRKTTLMHEWVTGAGLGRRGLDVGCGQGWYVARMRELGFDVSGIDYSSGQVALAARHVGDASIVRVGSALAIPAADASVDFVYTINVLHHLPSVDAQRQAFAEILRVLTPGGVVFVHEINTTNVLFRFYMGYVFPSLNCIDEGIERWLLPRELATYTSATVADVQYFTFFPDFMPQALVRALAPIERWLERSRWRHYSAHYMAVLRKPA